jgi:hypothetical protein
MVCQSHLGLLLRLLGCILTGLLQQLGVCVWADAGLGPLLCRLQLLLQLLNLKNTAQKHSTRCFMVVLLVDLSSHALSSVPRMAACCG